MEVKKNNFFDELPTILKRISNADFIALDLELSGIPERKGGRKGRATLQERYTEIREAAAKYQILQVGLTVVERDVENKRYLIRPYNFNLSPLVEDERHVAIEREFTYSSSAVNFLRNQGYDMSSPFSGVPYLTRQETELAWSVAKRRYDRTLIPDIDVPASHIQATEFIARVRREIKAWFKDQMKGGSIEIAGREHDNPNAVRMLNRFEKRLVHQVVRSDFKNLETFSLLNSVKVKPKSNDVVDPDQEPWRRHTGEAICLQTGFRFVTEAIAAGNLDDLNASLCARRIAGEPEAATRGAFKKQLQELAKACVERPKVIVGHNCFLDIVYLFKLFYGDLPEDVKDFQAVVNETFPLVFDTKFMVTEGAAGNRFRGSPLEEIDRVYGEQMVPDVYQIRDHPQYADTDQSYHEAGFDSFVTARVFLRLAARTNAFASGRTIEQIMPPKRENQPLQQQSSEQDQSTPLHYDGSDEDDAPQQDAADIPAYDRELLPTWNDDFWDPYRNKLRVFGTVEEMCTLQPKSTNTDKIEIQSTSRESAEAPSMLNRLWSLVL